MAEEEYQVYGTSQDRDDPRLRNKGIIPVELEFGDYDSFMNALKESQASVVVVITGDGYGTKRFSQNNEFENAKLIIDAWTDSQNQIDHLFVASLFACDEVPDAAVTFNAKQHIEHYLYQQMSVNPGYFHYDIIRAGLLFEMMDAQAGKLVNLFAPDAKLPFVASIDVGKAVIAMLMDSDTWGTGQILHAISCMCTGKDCAVGLSEAITGACTASIRRCKILVYG
jgi:hypothetical protein